MGAYATRDDVFNLALSARAFVVRPSPFEAADLPTGTIRLTAHGLNALDLVLFSAVSGGALPPELSPFVYYTPHVLGADLFQVSPATGGPIVAPFSAAGVGWSVALDPGRRLDLHLVDAAAVIDEHLTAHEPPLLVDPRTGKFPQVIVGLNARMAARRAVTSLQIENAAFKIAVDRLFAIEEQDLALLADWKNGKPVQPRPTDQDPLVNDNSARAQAAQPVHWRTGVL